MTLVHFYATSLNDWLVYIAISQLDNLHVSTLQTFIKCPDNLASINYTISYGVTMASIDSILSANISVGGVYPLHKQAMISS